MLVLEYVKIKIRKDQIKYYINLNYEICNNEVNVNSYDLHNGSSAIVNIICDECGEILSMKYKVYYQSIKKYENNLYYCKKCKYSRIKQTNITRHGVENVMQIKSVKDKCLETQKKLYGYSCFGDREKTKVNIIKKYGDLDTYYNIIGDKKKKTCLDKYGVENVMNVEDIKLKGQQTCMDRYGEKNPMFVDSFAEKSKNNQIKTKLIKGLIIPDEQLTNFQKYRKRINRLIYKYSKDLYKKWDGYDYYDKEYIKDNFILKHTDPNYPTIDHKISVYHGFTNNIEPEIIGDISNLCITKRKINSSKCKKTPYEFLKKEINKDKMKTKIICILDRSGSMSSIINDAIGGFNTFLQDQKEIDGECKMDILLFDTEFNKIVNNIDVREVTELNRKTYSPGGGTSLYDAIGMSIENELDFLAENPENRSDKTLCVILTDGEENASRKFNQQKIKLMISEMEEQFKWDFIFLAANQDAVLTASGMGISAGKSMNFAATGDGITVAYASISKATKYYRTTTNDNYDNIFKESEE